jgi:hypothetical protein
MLAIHNLSDLKREVERDKAAVEDFCRQEVTVDSDLRAFLRSLSDNEESTHINVKLARDKKRGLGIHPSAACKEDACLLKLYYDCTGEIYPSKKFVLESQMTWDLGTLIHCTLQEWLLLMYGSKQFQSEVPLRHAKLHVKSHADGLFTFNPCRFILEIKSIKEGGNYGFEKVQLRPMKDNVRQAHFYMYVADVPFALLFYFCKNNSQWKEHPVIFDFDLWDKIVKDTVSPVIDAAYNDGPPVEASPGWRCKWCDYEHSCASAKSYKSKGEANAAKSARQWSRSRW